MSSINRHPSIDRPATSGAHCCREIRLNTSQLIDLNGAAPTGYCLNSDFLCETIEIFNIPHPILGGLHNSMQNECPTKTLRECGIIVAFIRLSYNRARQHACFAFGIHMDREETDLDLIPRTCSAAKYHMPFALIHFPILERGIKTYLTIY